LRASDATVAMESLAMGRGACVGSLMVYALE
jgi:hypothetical protein